MLRDHLEDVRVVRANRHDYGAIHVACRRQEALRSAERTASRLEARDLDAGAVLKDLHLRQIGSRHLQVQRAFVRLEPEFLAELVSVALLAHVERALAEAARQGARDRQRLFEFEDALIVCVFFPQDFTAAGSETNPLTTGREVPGDEAVPNQFQNPLRRTLL